MTDSRRRGSPPPAGGPTELEDLPPRWQERLLKLAPSLLRLGLATVVSAEEPGEEKDGPGKDCGRRVGVCRAVCCSFLFALTGDEVAAGKVTWDRQRPHLIARGADGFCTHLDRRTRRCRIYGERPLRCRRYDCLRDSSFWEDGEDLAVRPGTFDHLL